MAKHDQRILKFLNQNADRAPTITEMMTRMNISISDISESLANLQAHGVISKKTNNQGIEYWFPTSPVAVPPPMPQVQAYSPHFATQQIPIQTPTVTPDPPIPVYPPPQPQARPMQRGEPVYSSSNLRGEAPRGETTPQMPQPPYPHQPQHEEQPQYQPPYQPQAQSPYQPEAQPQAQPRYQSQPVTAAQPILTSAATGAMPIYGLSQPGPKGIGWVTFLLGLAATAGLSFWLAGQQVETKMKKASSAFVDRKSLAETNLAFNDFQAKTKTHVFALEAEVKKLSAELAFSKAAAESLKTVVAAKPDKLPAAVAATKGKAIKKAVPVAKAKPKAKAKSTSSSASAMAKAAARGAEQRRKAAASESSTNESLDINSSYEPSYPEPSRGLPDRPGLEELPPPPTE